MANKVDLQELIKSLSSSEKRYFRMNAERNSNGKSKRFMALFEAVDKGKPTPPNLTTNPSVATNYLYASILNNLTNYQEAGLPEKKIARWIDHALILYKKGLAAQSMKLLERGYRLADQYEDHIQIQSICNLQRIILASHRSIRQNLVSMEEVLNRNLKAAKNAELLARLRFVQYRFQTEVLNFSSVDKVALDELAQILDDTAMKEVDETSTIRSQITVNHIRSQFHLLANNQEKGMAYGRKVFDLSYNNYHRLYEGGSLVVAGANNYMVRCHRANAMDEIERVLKLLDNQSYKVVSIESKRKEVYYTHWLGHAITTGKTDDPEIIENIDQDLIEYGDKMNQAFLMLIFCLVSQYAFLRCEYRLALSWINRFLIHDNKKHLAKNIAIAEAFRLLIYYQQSKLNVLENELLASEKSGVSEIEYPLITEILNTFFWQELREGDKRDAHVSELRSALTNLKKSASEKEAFEFFPFDIWANSAFNLP